MAVPQQDVTGPPGTWQVRVASLAAFHALLLLLCRCRFVLLIYRHYLCLEILLKLFLAPLPHPRNAEMPGTLVSSCTSHLAPQGRVSQQQGQPQTFLGLYPMWAWNHLHLVLTFPKASITLVGVRAPPRGATTTSNPPCSMRWGAGSRAALPDTGSGAAEASRHYLPPPYTGE